MMLESTLRMVAIIWCSFDKYSEVMVLKSYLAGRIYGICYNSLPNY